jgi:signal transduction histidine kinase
MTPEQNSTGEIKYYSHANARDDQTLKDFIRIASAVCRTPAAFILIYEGIIPRIISSLGLEAADLALIARLVPPPDELARLLVTESSLQEEAEASGLDSSIRFCAAVPIEERGKPLGLIGLADHLHRPNLTPQETEGLLALSRQLAALLLRGGFKPPARFQPQDQRAASMAGHQRLEEQLRESIILTSSDITWPVEEEEARQQLLRRVVVAHEEERKRIAREVHDQLSQHLMTLNLGLESLKRTAQLPAAALDQIKDLQRLLDVLARESYRIERNLHPAALERTELSEALQEYVEQWSGQTGIPLKFECEVRDAQLSLPVKIALYRIVQEALTNIYKHAGAAQSSVSLKQRGREVILIVEDNGSGLNLDAPRESTRIGLGLRSMRERVELLGGNFELESTPGKGVCVFARLPITTDKEAEDGKAQDLAGG